MLIAILMLIIGFLAGIIATISYCAHLDAKLIAKHGKENVEPMNYLTATILNH